MVGSPFSSLPLLFSTHPLTVCGFCIHSVIWIHIHFAFPEITHFVTIPRYLVVAAAAVSFLARRRLLSHFSLAEVFYYCRAWWSIRNLSYINYCFIREVKQRNDDTHSRTHATYQSGKRIRNRVCPLAWNGARARARSNKSLILISLSSWSFYAQTNGTKRYCAMPLPARKQFKKEDEETDRETEGERQSKHKRRKME